MYTAAKKWEVVARLLKWCQIVAIVYTLLCQLVCVWHMCDLYTCTCTCRCWYSVNLLSLGANFLFCHLHVSSLIIRRSSLQIHVHYNLLDVWSKSNNGRTKFTMLRQIGRTYFSYYFQLCMYNTCTYMYNTCTYMYTVCTYTCTYTYAIVYVQLYVCQWDGCSCAHTHNNTCTCTYYMYIPLYPLYRVTIGVFGL